MLTEGRRGATAPAGARLVVVMKQVGVVLCGCGRHDGSEIHESVLVLLHLSRAGVRPRCMAPDAAQWATCDAFSGQPLPVPPRSQLAEAARIARGDVVPLLSIPAAELDALVLPGGSGAARNLAAAPGARRGVRAELQQLLEEMHAARKPIGALCIAPALVALALGRHRPRLTLGTLDGPAREAAAAGAEMVACAVDDVVVDERNRIVSTPAYILARRISEVDAGIQKLVAGMIQMME